MIRLAHIIVRTLWAAIEFIVVILLISIIALVFLNVVMRYGFSSGLRASVELSRIMLVWIVLLGAVIVLKRDEHLAVNEISEAIFPKLTPYFYRFSWVIIALSAALLFLGATKQTISNWNNISQLTGLPKGLLYLPGAISGALMIFVALFRLFSPLQKRAAS